MLKNLLLYRFVIFNALMMSLMAWLAAKGYVGLVFASDPTGISLGIAALFGLNFINTCIQVKKVTKQKNTMKDLKWIGEATVGEHKDMLSSVLKRIIKLRSLKLAADTMSLLGIIGTVVGFIVAFAVQDPSVLVGGGVDSMGSNVLTMIKGMSIALYTTLTGAVLGGWSLWNWAMIKDATDILKVDEDVR